MVLETGNVIKLTYEKKGIELTFGQRQLALTVGYGVSVIGGDVYGGSSSTDNAIARYNGTTGKVIQNSLVTIDDNGSVNIPTGQAYKINGTALAYSDVGAQAPLVSGTNIKTINSTTILGSGDMSLEPALPATPENPATKFLDGNRQWNTIAIGAGGFAGNLYFTTQDSDVSGYKKISYVNEAAETELSGTLSNQEVALRTYLYDSGLATTVIDAGVWIANYRCKISGTQGDTQLKLEVFLRHIDNSETVLWSDYSPILDNTSYATIRSESNQPAFSCVTTDRLGARIYGKVTSMSAVTIYTIIGDGDASYFTTPLAIRHSQLRNLNGDNDYLHVTSTEKSTWDNKQAGASNLTSLSGLAYVSPSFVKMTGANTFALDTNTYLTSLTGAVLTDQTSGQTIGDTTNRLTKLWATDITCTNAISGSVTGNAGTVTNATLTTALTVNTGTLTLTANNANTSVLTIGAGASLISGSNTGDQTLATIPIGVIGTPAIDTADEYINYMQSGGRFTGGVVTAHAPADGTVDISELKGLIHTSEAVGSALVSFTMSAQASLALTDNALNYIYIDYNSGTPVAKATTDRTTIHEYDHFTLARAYREGTDVDIISSGTNIYNAYRRIHNRLVKKYGFDWASGSTLSESGTRKLAVTLGTWYIGNTEITTPALDTNVTGSFSTYYLTGSTWTKTDSVTQLGNTQYNDTSSGLVTMTANKYANYWVYQCPEGGLYVLYGQAQYNTLAEAIATSSPASVPNYVTYNTRLIARITFLKSATNFAQVTNAHTTSVPSAMVSLHNNLGNLAWSSSGHTGTASNIAGFDGTGVASYYTLTGTGTVLATSTSPTFATSINGSYLTASEILITDGSKNIVSAPVATYPSLTELSYVKGLSSAVQTQLGNKAPTASPTFTGEVTIPNTGLHILDTNASHDLIVSAGSDLSADRTLTVKTGDTDMILDLTAVTDEYVLAYDVTSNTWRGVSGGAGGGASTALDNLSSVAINTTLVSDTDNTDALGTVTKAWSDLFLGNGGVITFTSAPDTADVTLTHSANTLTLGGGDLALGANNLGMTGSIGVTGSRVTKLWATDIESTNMPTVGGTAILTSLTAPQFTTIELGHASDTTLSRSAAGVLAVEGKNVLVNDAGVVSVFGSSTTAGTIKIYEDTDDGSHSISIKAPALAGDYTLTLPTTDGAANEFLQTDGSGNLTWAASSGGTTILKAVKTADETVNNSDTYQDDDHLTVTVEANATYIVRMVIYTNGATSTAQALKFQLTMPSGASGEGVMFRNSTGAAAFVTTAVSAANPTVFTTSCAYAGNGIIQYEGIITTSSTAGSVTLQWAQNVAETINRTLKIGSSLILTKI